MLRHLKQLILTTLFALFASQASAMFIQPDWLDPTKPGVGTNRYSYSFNDPINLSDPGGNDIDDDPRDHSTDSDEFDTARGQEGQSVDEARERARLDAETEAVAQEMFGKSFGELNGLQRAAAAAKAAAQNGLLGPTAHAMTTNPTGPVTPGMIGRPNVGPVKPGGLTSALPTGSLPTSAAARREVMRQQGVPTSQQPISQTKTQSGTNYVYEVPKPGGGTQLMGVQQKTLDRSHTGQPHWEAGPIKMDPLTGQIRTDRYGTPRLSNDKSSYFYQP